MNPSEAKERGIKVRALVWDYAPTSSNSMREVAEGLSETYEVLRWVSGDFGGSIGSREFGGKASIDAAKAACQADYEARILAALE